MDVNIVAPEGDNHEIVSDDIQEIISHKPNWIIRRGNIIFLVVTIFLFALTWFIKYPDIVNASAKLVALNPPKLVAAKVEGKLLKLLVANNQQVVKGQVLGFMESTANYKQVISLRQKLAEVITFVQNNHYDLIDVDSVSVFSELGELQSDYEGLQNELLQTRQTLANGYYQKKKRSLEKDLNYISVLKSNTGEQKRLLQQDKELQAKEFKAYELLAKDKIIAPLELNQYKSKLIAKEQNLQQADAQLTNGDISMHNKEKEILDLQKTITDQQQKFYAALLSMKSQVEKWLYQYQLTAPEDGKVLFISSLKENELISNGQSLFFIEPNQSSFYAELMAGQRGLGKVKEGQQVLVRVNGFPSTEFGYINGNITFISGIPNSRDSFLIKVNLPKGLQTNYGKRIFFRNNLSAQAEIMTDNRKLFDRLMGQLKQVLER